MGIFSWPDSRVQQERVFFGLDVGHSCVGRLSTSACHWAHLWAFHRLVRLGILPLLLVENADPDYASSNIVVQLVASQTFTAPPWNWTIHSIGLLSISGFVGTLVSFFVGGRLIDLIAVRMTARRAERPEPEFRLPAMVIPAVVGPMGMLCYGLIIATQDGWAGAAIGYGMVGFGGTAASNIIITYAVDAYRPVSISGNLG